MPPIGGGSDVAACCWFGAGDDPGSADSPVCPACREKLSGFLDWLRRLKGAA